MTHTDCQHQDDNKLRTEYAKRFLKVDDSIIALVENVQVDRYACLSHCWGISNKPVKTTTRNIDKHMAEIPFEQISATFQHAITICRALDISYLWIDSLCIVQDSQDDWNNESVKMASIYENAYVTIAATKSLDGTGGCFATTAPKYMSKPVPGYKDVYVRQELPEFPRLSSNYRLSDSPDWPLFNRAWIYQEMRLSRRVLHFCAQEIIWVCRTRQKSESGDNDRDLTTATKSSLEGMSDICVPYSHLQQHPTRLWYRMIQEYTRLQLSVKEDKMVAVAGIAQRMERLRSGDRYLAGLWEKSLLLDLLWEKESWNSPSRPRIARYPSWSWASLDGQVSWSPGSDLALESVVIEKIDYTSHGPVFIGHSVHATITLKASLLDAGPFFTHYRSYRATRRPVNGHRPYQNEWRDPYTDVITNLDHLYVAHHQPDLATDKSEENLAESDHPGFIVPIAAENRHQQSFGALHIRRKSGSNHYERVGHVKLAHPATVPDRGPWAEDEDEERKIMNSPSIRKLLEALPTSTIVLE